MSRYVSRVGSALAPGSIRPRQRSRFEPPPAAPIDGLGAGLAIPVQMPEDAALQTAAADANAAGPVTAPADATKAVRPGDAEAPSAGNGELPRRRLDPEPVVAPVAPPAELRQDAAAPPAVPAMSASASDDVAETNRPGGPPRATPPAPAAPLPAAVLPPQIPIGPPRPPVDARAAPPPPESAQDAGVPGSQAQPVDVASSPATAGAVDAPTARYVGTPRATLSAATEGEPIGWPSIAARTASGAPPASALAVPPTAPAARQRPGFSAGLQLPSQSQRESDHAQTHVTVSIERLEVRAPATQPAAPARQAQRHPHRRPQTLDEYMRSRPDGRIA